MVVLTWRGKTGPRIPNVQLGPVKTDFNSKDLGETPKVYRLTNTGSADPSTIKLKEIAYGFKDAQGLCVVNGDIYVGDIDRIVKLVDKDGDGYFETLTEIGKIPWYICWFEYSFGPVYKDGYFYMALAAGVQWSGRPATQYGKDRSTVVKVPLTGGTYSVVAEGLRAPDGIGLGPNNDIFVTDNQGAWRPASQFLHIVPGRFYGYSSDTTNASPKGSAAQVVSPPAIWMPHLEANPSPTEPALMKTGIFAGQFIYGDIAKSSIYRAQLEKVNGEYQGGSVAFSGGFEGGIHRIKLGPNGEVYAGGLGVGDASTQGWNGTTFALQKLTPNGYIDFEILSAHSRAGGMELEFTLPVASVGDEKNNYNASQWAYTPVHKYGEGMGVTEKLVVKSIQVSSDRKRVFLAIDGLKAGDVIYLSTTNLISQDNKTLWFGKTWYTLNAISTSVPFEATGIKQVRQNNSNGEFLRLEKLAGKMNVILTL